MLYCEMDASPFSFVLFYYVLFLVASLMVVLMMGDDDNGIDSFIEFDNVLLISM